MAFPLVLTVWKKWCREKEIADTIENYQPAEVNNLLKRFYAEINVHVRRTL